MNRFNKCYNNLRELKSELKKELEDSYNLRMDEIREETVIVGQQITTLNDKTETNINSLRDELKTNFCKTDAKIHESEQRLRDSIKELDEKVNKGSENLLAIIRAGYEKANHKMEMAVGDLDAKVKALNEKSNNSLTLMNKQIALNQETVENKLSILNLDHLNLSDRVTKNFTNTNNNFKDLDRRLRNVSESDLPSKIEAEMSVVVNDYRAGHQQVTNRLVAVEYAILIAKQNTIPAVVGERLTALSEKIDKLGVEKPAAPMPKTEMASDEARPTAPPVWKVDNSMGSVTMRRHTSIGKAQSSSGSSDGKGRKPRAESNQITILLIVTRSPAIALRIHYLIVVVTQIILRMMRTSALGVACQVGRSFKLAVVGTALSMMQPAVGRAKGQTHHM